MVVDTRVTTRTTTARLGMTEVVEADAVDAGVVAEEEGTRATGRVTTLMTTAEGEKRHGLEAVRFVR